MKNKKKCVSFPYSPDRTRKNFIPKIKISFQNIYLIKKKKKKFPLIDQINVIFSLLSFLPLTKSTGRGLIPPIN